MKFYSSTILLSAILIQSLLTVCLSLSKSLRIGVLYDTDENNDLLELFVKEAIDSVNNNEDMLMGSKLIYDKLFVHSGNSFQTYNQICQELQKKLIALLGPQNIMSLAHVKSISEALEVPHLQYNWDHTSTKLSHISLNLFPQSEIMSQAFLDVIIKWQWNDIIILYQNYTALIKLQSIIKEPPSETMKVRVINVNNSTYLRIMRMVKSMRWSNIIIDGSPWFTERLLKTALQLEMMNEHYHYFLTVLDVEAMNLEDYKYNGVKLNGYKIFYDPYMKTLWNKYGLTSKYQMALSTSQMSNKDLHTEAAMIYDAILVLAHGLQLADKGSSLTIPNISCDRQNPTEYGTSLLNYMNSVEITGLTGPIKFKNGVRSYINLDLMELGEKGLNKIGYWTPNDGIKIIAKQEDFRYTQKMISNKSFIITSILRPLVITTILESPYVMHSKCHKDNSCATENDHFEGFCMDMLSKVARKLGFKYKIIVVPDGKYGAPDLNGDWTGMIRELMDNRADLAVAPLTINWLREQVVDFTKPFMSLGISILFKLPEKSKPGLFSFLNPLSFEIWVYVIAAYLGVSIFLFALSRFSPYEWVNTHPPCCVAQYLYNNNFNCDIFTSETNSSSYSGNKKFSLVKKSVVDPFAYLNDHDISKINKNSGNGTHSGSPFYDDIDCKEKDFIRNRVSIQSPHNLGLKILKDSMIKENENHDETSVKDSAKNMRIDIFQPSILNEKIRNREYYEPPIVENRFNLMNSLWFSLGTLMQQGSDISPSATSTRIIGGVWWFFTLILISSYTANLAAFLTVEKMVSPIESAEDLAEQTVISYGTLASGSTFTFFKNAKVNLFQKMWRFMESRPHVFPQTQDEGVKKVMDGNYAFFMESTTIDYIIQRNCNLTQIGGLLDSKGYGIGTHLGSPFRDPISLAILEMQENGQITLLYNKWWKNIGVTCHRDAISKESKASELGLENVGGIFVVLLGGIACSLVVGIIEFMWKARKNADSYKQSVCSQMGEELKYAIRCKDSRQRPRLKRQCSQCNNTSSNAAHQYIVNTNHENVNDGLNVSVDFSEKMDVLFMKENEIDSFCNDDITKIVQNDILMNYYKA
ncbi:unnamed protein product [Gordionus sp. m RMFG-2023]|uniref:glutamate receptor ionotropic, kainate 2-like n=1 Tax=Gordionus sp. m RMFG-2023 TaxID=3053472 RepID=UPI0030E4B95F